MTQSDGHHRDDYGPKDTEQITHGHDGKLEGVKDVRWQNEEIRNASTNNKPNDLSPEHDIPPCGLGTKLADQ
jgi:hypothetical protein